MKLIDLTGKKFGNWTVLKKIDPFFRVTKWKCVCLCGNEVDVCGSSLKNGTSTKCIECRKLELIELSKLKAGVPITHGMSYKKEYRSWSEMKSRCINPNHQAYKNYGGRGILVCDEWSSFDVFYKDMGPARGLSLDRIDNNGNYCRENCRWATAEQQCNNRRNNKKALWIGVPYTVSQLERLTGMPRAKISKLIDDGHLKACPL